ncbi:Uncharacterized protein dnm_086670 [Desulfonema magnum]|uniref:Uncharacterized protein n=1 Tax=Desulfonema magnum TaxID=45655 RepID=A0A975BW46_9BACT|nr:Uncharacterized protein dnm_086670 [Desulfonema magnum]
MADIIHLILRGRGLSHAEQIRSLFRHSLKNCASTRTLFMELST